MRKPNAQRLARRISLPALLASFLLVSFSAHAIPVAVGESLMPIEDSDIVEPTLELVPTIGVSVFNAQTKRTTYNTTQGFAAGMLADIATSLSNLKIETGAIVIQEGDAQSNVNFKRTNNYLAIPGLVKYRPFKWKVLPYVRAGLTPAFLFSAHRSSASAVGDSTGQTLPLDLQATLGLGVSYPIGLTTSVLIDATFMRGLVSFLRDSTPIYNQGFVFSAGIAF